jgi:hypothetical protein
MFYHVRRIPMDALDVETSIAEAEQALQALLQFARQDAGTLEAHEAEKGIFKRLLPIGLAAMKLYFAQRGTGDMGAAITRADGVTLPQEPTLRGRDDFSLFGKFKVARTCYRTAGEPGIFPLDAQVNLPERCYSYFLPEWMTVFAVDHRNTAQMFPGFYHRRRVPLTRKLPACGTLSLNSFHVHSSTTPSTRLTVCRAVQNQLLQCGSRRSVNVLPSPEHNNEAVLAAIHASQEAYAHAEAIGTGGLQATWPFFRSSLD